MARNTRTPFPLADSPEINQEYEEAFLASIAVGPDEQGHYRTIVKPTGSKNYDDAAKAIQRLHRPRKRKKYLKNGKMQYGLHCEVITLNDGTYAIKYHATTREAALRYLMETRGDDPTKWSYSTNPEHPNYNL
jgi:hypothetical protein